MLFQNGLELKLIYFLIISAVLFGIGIYGVLTKRHLIHVLLSV